jgi:hypothetical protein
MLAIDVDAHLHEPVDWFERIDPQLAGILGELLRFIDTAVGRRLNKKCI